MDASRVDHSRSFDWKVAVKCEQGKNAASSDGRRCVKIEVMTSAETRERENGPLDEADAMLLVSVVLQAQAGRDEVTGRSLVASGIEAQQIVAGRDEQRCVCQQHQQDRELNEAHGSDISRQPSEGQGCRLRGKVILHVSQDNTVNASLRFGRSQPQNVICSRLDGWMTAFEFDFHRTSLSR